jgi:hypothetical protein
MPKTDETDRFSAHRPLGEIGGLKAAVGFWFNWFVISISPFDVCKPFLVFAVAFYAVVRTSAKQPNLQTVRSRRDRSGTPCDGSGWTNHDMLAKYNGRFGEVLKEAVVDHPAESN